MADTVKTGEFCWNELMTNDVEKCKEFYKALFGWQAHDLDMNGEFTYTLLRHGEKDIAGMMKIPQGHEQEIPPHWMSYVGVEDLDSTVAKAKSLGATIKQEPMPVSDFGRLAVLQDPSGAHIALWQSTKPCS